MVKKKTLGWSLGIVGVVLVLVMGWALTRGQSEAVFDVSGEGNGDTVSVSGASGAGQIVINPSRPATTTLTSAGVDKLEAGTTVAHTRWVGKNGGELVSGLAEANPTDVLEVLLVNDSDYHNAYLPTCTIPETVGALTIDTGGACNYGGFLENATLTLTAFNEDANSITNGTRCADSFTTACSAGAATVNQTAKAAGSTYNLELKLDGESKASTQKMKFVIETNNRTGVRDVIIGGTDVVKVVVPNFYATQGASSETYAYDMPAVEGAVTRKHGLQVETESTAILSDYALGIGACFLVNGYTYEYFIDIDGDVSFDVQNTNNVLQSMAVYQTSFCIS